MRLGRIFGFTIKLHFSVLILAALIMYSFSSAIITRFPEAGMVGSGLLAVLAAVGFLGSILAHELGHAIVGERVGMRFGDIYLHLFGGAAMMTGRVPSARAEFLCAAAGPAVSIILAPILMLIGFAIGGPTGYTIGNIGFINLILGVFNLLPVFPMDGGRIFRAGVWKYKKNFYIATRVAVKVGKVFALALMGCGALMIMGVYIPFLGVGMFSGLWIGFIAFMIMKMGEQELKQVMQR